MEESKEIIYEHTCVDKALHRLNVWFLPFRWGINPYRGCEHNCLYCNARYTHEYLDLPTGEVAYKIMVTTKSDLILRDIDILKKIARTGFLNVVITIPMLDEGFRKMIEPKAPEIKRRLEVVKQLHDAGITVGVTSIPLFPHISEGEGSLENLTAEIAKNGADYLIIDMLNFREEAKKRVMAFIKKKYPELVPDYEKLYKTDYCDKEFAKKIRKYSNGLIKKYKLDNYDKMFSYRKKVDVVNERK